MDACTFQAYAAIVEQVFGIQLPAEKQTLLESRLLKLTNEHHAAGAFHDAETFLHWVQEDRSGEAVRLLGEAITTHHTFFMREKEHFDLFREQTLPWLEQAAAGDHDLRVWCAASSTGEEAYTLAMLLADYFALKGTWERTLLATDVSEEVLATAARGLYPREAVAVLPPSWQRLYFRPCGEQCEVVPSLRQAVLFRPFNLMTPQLPFRRPFQAIFCRNVMIYFDHQRRTELVRRFYDALVPGGWLFVGQAETITRDMAPLQYVEPSVYRKPAQEGRKVYRVAEEAAPTPAPAPKPAQAKAQAGRTSIRRHKQTAAAPQAALPSLLQVLAGDAAPLALELVAIGASTGGTEALAEVLHALVPPLPPIVVVQHIPPHFSRLFAERLDAECRLQVKEAEEGDRLQQGWVYIAPGDKHVRVRRLGGLQLTCQPGPLVSGHCPSVDVLFHSVAELGKKTLGVILTGMGEDGAAGLAAMRRAGASTLGQDEQTSVVYGMPRAAYLAGAVQRQLPLPLIAATITNLSRQEV